MTDNEIIDYFDGKNKNYPYPDNSWEGVFYDNIGGTFMLNLADALWCSQAGDMTENVRNLSEQKYIKEQIEQIPEDYFTKALEEAGVLDDLEDKSIENKIQMCLWMACAWVRDEAYYMAKKAGDD